MKSLIYDYETLSQDRINGVVVNLAVLAFDTDTFTSAKPFQFQELLQRVRCIKFDVRDQVETYSRTISKDTLAWWKQQGDVARQQLKPVLDRDRPISDTLAFLEEHFAPLKSYKYVFTRGNTFDPFFLASTLAHFDQGDPFNWWAYRDTRSVIDGMTWGSGIDNRFMPPEPEGLAEQFIAHDPAHDIALDVLRLQYCVRQIS